MKRPRKAVSKPTGRKANSRRAKLRTRLAGLEALEHRLVLDSTVVFNEIMYNPLDDANDELEWIELHNQLAVDMDVSEWRLEGGIEFDFPDGTIVRGRGYLVVAANPAALEASTGFSGAIGPFMGRLNNGGEELRLFNNDGRRMNVLDYGDNGEWPVEADGGGASLAKGDRLTNSEDAENWTFSSRIGGTPGTGNVVSVENVQINEIAAADQENFFIEIANDGGSPVNVGGYVLSHTGLGGGDFVLPAQTIAAGGRLVVNGDDLPFSPTDGERLFLYTPGKGRLIDGRVVTNSLRGRSVEYDGQWLWPDVPTPGATNNFDFRDEIVINEILYHAPPQLRTDTQPYLESDEEWIELYNRGNETIDLSGWRLRDAVDFEFEVGLTIGPGEYLVVAKDAESVKAKYGITNVVGNFGRSLSNHDDRILLIDANKNPADEVHYYESGKWAAFADGGGSSLELRDPDADNAEGIAWAASDETSKSEWTEYTFTGRANEPLNCCGGFNEWIFGLLDSGEFLLDDISLKRENNATQLIQNGTFQSDTLGRSPAKWRLIGNHSGTVVIDPDNPNNKVLHVVAAGAQAHVHDHAETTFVSGQSISAGSDYTISFRAKWLGGNRQLNNRLYFTRMSNTAILDAPEKHGTPGAANTALETNIGPTYSDFGHAPVLPRPGQPVNVSV
ncbi:MAG: lamin tail domain-containing protein [Planctomycetes bacterium]|nr:lamin tail domain-containing protein [Planctomycetota bacterium]